MTDTNAVDHTVEHPDDGLLDPNDRPNYNEELSPTLLASGAQQGKKEDV